MDLGGDGGGPGSRRGGGAAGVGMAGSGRRPRPAGRVRVAIAGPPDIEDLGDALAGRRDVEVELLVDVESTSTAVRSSPKLARRPLGALGRWSKYHDYDHVVAVVDGPGSRAWEWAARRGPVHVWLRGGPAEINALEVSALASARSVIADDAEVARQVLGIVSPAVRVLHLRDAAQTARLGAEAAGALVEWLVSGSAQRGDRAATARATDTLS